MLDLRCVEGHADCSLCRKPYRNTACCTRVITYRMYGVNTYRVRSHVSDFNDIRVGEPPRAVNRCRHNDHPLRELNSTSRDSCSPPNHAVPVR